MAELNGPRSAVLFQTLHGSRLYGLAHEGSDTDVFVVTSATRLGARHSMNADGIDISTRGLDQFLLHASSGSHQSVEALFSPLKEWTERGLAYRPMIEAMRVSGPDVLAKYCRTIVKFSFGDFKRRRHAVRLAQNMEGLRSYGRFNPVMTADDAERASRLAQDLQGDALVAVLLSTATAVPGLPTKS